MRPIGKALDLLHPGEAAIVIFTDGRDFEVNSDDSGSTAYWVIDPNRPFNKVIVYKRDEVSNTNEVYVALPGAIAKHSKSHWKRDRYKIELSNVKLEGITDAKWPEFAANTIRPTGTNPIRYLTKL